MIYLKKAIKKCIAFISAFALIIPTFASLHSETAIKVNADSNEIVAFPGAVGGGKYATGGRGGEVYHVTNLNDSGTGSLRDAVSSSSRIVVFDVSGTIELKSNIICSSNITIAGQTAPGGSGVTLKNYKFGMGGDNIIVRYLSSRPGPANATSSGNDAWGGAAGSNSMVDHCSLGWTTDEQWGLYSNNMNYTVQYSVIGPANSWGGHVKGVHGFGLMMGKGNLTFDHNLIIHNVSRNFRGKVQSTYTADFTNNIIYDWGYQTAYGTIGHLNYVNNTLKAGNSTTSGYHWMNVDSGTSPENFKVYCDGNRLINKDGSLHEITNDNWSGVSVKTSIGITKDDLYSASPFQTLVNGVNVSSVSNAESAESSYEHVISFAGNGISTGKRTKIDQQCADETKNGTGSCSGTDAYSSSEASLDKYNIACGVTYEYPSAVLTKEITDSDNDGMSDEWELARGLDPNNASDTKGDYCGYGYTNIEYYINDLTIDSFPEGVVTLSPEVQTKSVNAFETIEAESYDKQTGIKTEDTSGGGQNIGFIESGDSAVYYGIDFGDKTAQSVSFRASSNSGGTVEIYRGNDLIGTAAISSMGGFSNYQEFTANLNTSVTGKGTITLKFTGTEGYLFNIDSFVFDTDIAPLQGTMITNLIVNDAENRNDWTIAENATIGSLQFGDRDVTFSVLPDILNDAEYIRTAADSKSVTTNLGTFTAGADMTVYVALDNRVTTVPEWLGTWTKTSLSISNSNGVIFELYSKNASKGDNVTLGANMQSSGCVCYSVFVTEQGSDYVVGDVNADGKFAVADVVMMQKWLLHSGDLTDWKSGDVCVDNKIDVFDLCMMKRLLLESIEK